MCRQATKSASPCDRMYLSQTRRDMLCSGSGSNSGYHITGWLLQASVPNEAAPFADVSSSPAWIERMDWFAPALAQFRAQLPRDGSKRTPRRGVPRLHRQNLPRKLSKSRLGASIKPSSLATPSNSTIILTSDVAVKLAYGQMTLRKGQRLLIVVSRTRFGLVHCGNEVIEIPITDTRPN